MDFIAYQKEYLSVINDSLSRIPSDQVNNFLEVILSYQGSKNKIMLVGNGGSALNATHFAMGVSIVSKNWESPIQSIALNESSAMITSISNDYSFEEVYSKLVEVYGREGDLLVILSSSGNSKNLVNAAEKAKTKGIKTFGLLGSDGGKLLSICDSSLHIASKEKDPGYAEDIHMILGHVLTGYLEHYVK